MNAIEAIDEILPTRLEESALGEEREREALQDELIARQTVVREVLASQRARSTWDAGDQQRAMLVAGRPAAPNLALSTDSNGAVEPAKMMPPTTTSDPLASAPPKDGAAAVPLETIVGTRFAAADRPIVQDTRTKHTEVRVTKRHRRTQRRDRYFSTVDLKQSKQMSWGSVARLMSGLGEELDRWEDPQVVTQRVRETESPVFREGPPGSVLQDVGAASAALAAMDLLRESGLLA